MHVNYFFINFTLKTKESQCFCLIFLMLTLKKFDLVYVICMHMISQPLYIVRPSEMRTFVRDAGVQKLPIASFHV